MATVPWALVRWIARVVLARLVFLGMHRIRETPEQRFRRIYRTSMEGRLASAEIATLKRALVQGGSADRERALAILRRLHQRSVQAALPSTEEAHILTVSLNEQLAEFDRWLQPFGITAEQVAPVEQVEGHTSRRWPELGR